MLFAERSGKGGNCDASKCAFALLAYDPDTLERVYEWPLVVTHDPRLFEIADRVLRLENGNLSEAGA